MKLDDGSFCLRVPASLLPTSEADYVCKLHVIIETSDAITFLSAPSDTLISKELDEAGKEKAEQRRVELEYSPEPTSTKDVSIYFQTAATNRPVLLAQTSDKHPDEVALAIALTPGFVEKPQSGLDVTYDERPEP